MSANDNVTSNRGQSRPRPTAKPRPNTTPAPIEPPRSSLPTETLREHLIEVITEIRGFQREVGAWPVAISQRLAVLFREAKEQNAALQASEAAGWKQEREEWARERAQDLHSLRETQRRLNNLVAVQEKHQAALVLGWSRDHLVGMLLGVVLSLALGGIYQQVGPPSQARSQAAAERRAVAAELSDYRRLWDTATTAEQKRIRERLENKTAAQ